MSAITTGSASHASEAWALIFELMHVSKKRFMAIAAEFELSPPQVMALRQLDPDEPKPMSELAAALRCDNSNVTGIVDRLEDRGLVARRAAEHDRRVKMLTITPRGAEIRAQLGTRLNEPPEPLASLSPEDQHALRDIMRRALGRD
jgi:DNA-binding MarR family transcriptional regulator